MELDVHSIISLQGEIDIVLLRLILGMTSSLRKDKTGIGMLRLIIIVVIVLVVLAFFGIFGLHL